MRFYAIDLRFFTGPAFGWRRGVARCRIGFYWKNR
jgi:hypothetical protein